MLRRSVVLFVFWCAAGAALAQAPSAPVSPGWHGRGNHAWMQERRRMAQRRMERVTVLLDLTAAQQGKVRAIMAEERARMKPSLEQLHRAFREVRDAHRAARRDAMHKLASVLSPTQMKKLRLLMPEHPHFMMRGRMGMHWMGMGGMGMGGMGPPPMAPAPPAPPAPPSGPGPR